MALQNVANFIGTQAIKGVRMGTIRYGPVAAAATEIFLRAADASRQFKRDAAIASEDPLTEEEYLALEGEAEHGDGAAPRAIRVYYHTIRASRGPMKTTGIDVPIAIFSHWSLEIGGVFYELREHDPDKDPNSKKPSERTILFEELGSESRKIKLEVCANRNIHPNVKFCDVSTTTLDDDKILWAASLIFGRFGSAYDLLIDNCQHFTQLLAETICGRENRDEVRKFFDKRSVMKLSVAASWLVAPVYGATVALHHGLRPETTQDNDEMYQKVGDLVENMEKFILHPRVYATRRRQNPLS